MDTLFSKPFAVVTGASSGIGFELAKQFAEHGYDLLIAAEDAEITRAAQELGKLPVSIESFRTDLATGKGVEALYKKIQETGRPVDAIAINAGVGVGGAFIDTSLSEEMNMIFLNVAGPVQLSKYIVRDMVARGQGRILYTASVVSTMPAPFRTVYGATKAFIFSFAEALRNELQGTGVSITSLRPGATETNFFHRANLDDTKVGASKKDNPADVARQGLEALMNGDAHVTAASLKSKIMGITNEILPESIKAAQHRKMAEPGSAYK